MPAQDQVVNATMALSLQNDAARKHLLVAWVVTRDQDAYYGQFVARLMTDAPTPYVLLGRTLGELHGQLPHGSKWSDRQPSDPPEVLEFWFVPGR